MSRREAIGLGLGFAGSAFLAGCLDRNPVIPDHLNELRFTAVPGPASSFFVPGLHPLDVTLGSKQALLYVPTSYVASKPAPLALLMHGAGGTPQPPIDLFQAAADQRGLCMLSCKSKSITWDAIEDRFTDDIPLMDEAMKIALGGLNVDPARVSVQGFSDGASMAIALGRANGDLFKRVSAQSPGTMLNTTGVQKPVFYISHGAQDEGLPVGNTRNMVSILSQVYTVIYDEFQGGHTIPPEIVLKAVDFLALP